MSLPVLNCSLRNACPVSKQPSLGWCELCMHRVPINAALPAVDWERAKNEVAVCSGRRNEWTAAAWMTLVDSIIRFDGERMIVPMSIYQQLLPFRTAPDEPHSEALHD